MRHFYIKALQDLAAEVPPGHRERTVCPCCNGGSSGEKSLSLYRRSETEAFFICYRAKCDLGGGHIALFSDTKGSILTHNARRPSGNDIVHNLSKVDEETVEYLGSKYHLTPQLIHYGRFQLTFDRRVYMHIFDTYRRKRGGSARKYKELYQGRREYASIPKNLNHMLNDDPVLSWYFKDNGRRKNSNTVVIVEDIPSALRLTPYVDSVSLMGTGLGAEKQREIRTMSYDRIFIALDEDATTKAFRYKKNCQLYLPRMSVIPLRKDIKDMTPEQLEELMNDYCGD